MAVELIFLPALVPWVTMERPLASTDEEWRRPIHWLRKDGDWGLIHHPYALLSYVYWHNEKWNGDADVIFGDSGGYSVITQGAIVDPKEVIKWQIRVCTRGVMLDIPPYRKSSSIQFTGNASQHWEESMGRTLENVRQALPFYRAYRDAGLSKFAWWGVVQGESRAQMEDWHTRVSRLYPFAEDDEGWALAPKPSNDLASNARYLKFAHDRGLRRVHLLQVTAPRVVGVALSLAVLSGNIDLITIDSASAVRNAINRGGVQSDGVKFFYTKQKGDQGPITEMMRVCPCQSCIWFREMDEPFCQREYPRRLAVHNLFQMLKTFEELKTAALQDPEWLIKRCAGKAFGAIMREWDGKESSKSQLVDGSLAAWL